MPGLPAVASLPSTAFGQGAMHAEEVALGTFPGEPGHHLVIEQPRIESMGWAMSAIAAGAKPPDAGPGRSSAVECPAWSSRPKELVYGGENHGKEAAIP